MLPVLTHASEIWCLTIGFINTQIFPMRNGTLHLGCFCNFYNIESEMKRYEMEKRQSAAHIAGKTDGH